MITKKTFVTTSSFLITAMLLSRFYAYSSANFTQSQPNLDAFKNLAANVQLLSAHEDMALISAENSEVNDEIINLISTELKQKIRKTTYAVNSFKPKMSKVKALTVIAVQEIITPEVIAPEYSDYEINNRELVNLYAINVEEMAYTKFENTKLASTYNTEVKDEVVVAQASTGEPQLEDEVVAVDEVKMIQRSPEKVEQSDEEMVMFDYSEKKAEPVIAKTMDQKLYERPISNAVKQAINREIASTPIKKLAPPKTTKIDNTEVDLASEDNTIYDYSNDTVKRTENATKDTEEAVNAFTKSGKEDNSVDTQFVIRAKEINLSTHKTRQAHAFEFVPDYERADRSDDQTSGEISLGYSLNGGMNTQTGIVQAQGMIPTRVELNLGKSEGIEIPLISEAGIQKFLQKENLAAEGNLLLIAIDPSIHETEIDSQYGLRFFFDNNFKVLESSVGASYVLYAGVKTGNVMIRYLLSNKESAQKIVYVGDGEMYFEDPDFSTGNRESFSFTTRNLLAQKTKELIIDGASINYFNTNVTMKKKALNSYEMKVPTQVSGMRKYFEFKHLKDSIFVGSSTEKEIEIPGNDFIAKVMDMNQVSSLKEKCIVQINLSKNVREIKANGKNRSGEMLVETTFIDRDGNFSRDSELSEKAFVVGDMEGLFSVRIDYTDGSTQFLKTFCSEGTYLVEQL